MSWGGGRVHKLTIKNSRGLYYCQNPEMELWPHNSKWAGSFHFLMDVLEDGFLLIFPVYSLASTPFQSHQEAP